MSDVYALLDYLSGRASPSLGPTVQGRPRRREEPDPQAAVDSIEHDLADQAGLLYRAMRIGEVLDGEAGEISFADAAFLISARDLLNYRAAPATGSSISFTIRVVGRLLGKAKRGEAPGAHYIVADRALDDSAAALAGFVSNKILILMMALLLTIVVSVYVAWGKLLLDAQDAVNRDFGANISTIVSHHEAGHDQAAPAGEDAIETICRPPVTSFVISQSCQQRKILLDRKATIHDLIVRWESPFFRSAEGEEAEQWAGTAIGVLGNYVLPVLYGGLGSLGFVLRRLNRQLADFLLTPRDLRASFIRIVLGTVTGACIGLFVNSSAGAATVSGLGGAAVTLSASGIAFLAGYGVEGVFKLLDSVVNHVFRINDQRREGAA
jgi:hypothetical protein